MGWNLSSNGGLTTSQRREAVLLGLSHEEYKKRLLERFQTKRGGIPRRVLEGYRKDDIKAEKPVLVIGGGPSSVKNMEKYNKFTIPKLVVEVKANECFKNGVIPDYIFTLETNKKYVVNDFFDIEKIREHGTKVIGSYITRNELKQNL